MQHIRIVLVEPSHPGNIGGAARAMKTMGLSDLAVVRPKRFPDPQADWRAAGAIDVIEQTQVHESLESAVGSSVLVAATSVRERHISWPVVSSVEFADLVHREREKYPQVSVVFGREDSGLTNEELHQCNMQIRIPSNEDYGSLNLAMSVQVVAYDLFQRQGKFELPSEVWDRPLATHGEIEDFYKHLESTLVTIDFYDPDQPREAMTRLRRMFSRMKLDQTEVQIMRGILTHVRDAVVRSQ